MGNVFRRHCPFLLPFLGVKFVVVPLFFLTKLDETPIFLGK